MISRYFVIAFAIGVAVVRAKAHAWVDAAGLMLLATGLICLRIADLRHAPILRKAAWACFALTLVALGIDFQRYYLR